MIVSGIKTHTITKKDTDITKIISRYVTSLQEKSILIITSKIVSICEGNMVSTSSTDKDTLIQNEAEYYIPRTESHYNVCLTINNGILAPSAGIDESNADDNYILWPKDPQKSANSIREFITNHYKIHHAGVLIIDSKTTPLRWGTTGIALSWSGFLPLKDYIGKPDLFDRTMRMTNQSLIDGLASSANLVMGEGNEATPIAIAQDLSFIEFVNRNPTQEEIQSLVIDPKDDLYEPILSHAPWKKRVDTKS